MLLIYLALLAITFLGLFTGLLIGYFTEEELKPGMKYFNIFRHLLFVAILVIFFVNNPSMPFIIFIALLIILYSLSSYRETLYYYSLAVIFFIAWRFNGFALIAPLIFLYGFPLGTIYLQEHINIKKKKKKIILGALRRYIGFLAVGALLGLLGLFI